MASINTRTQLLLAANSEFMSPSLQEAAKANKLGYADGVYFKRYKLPKSASGLQDILKNDDAQVDGVCSISKQKLPQGSAFECDRVSVRVAYVDNTEGTNTTTAGEQTYVPISEANTLKALQCAELELTVAQKKVFQIPLNAFNQEIPNINSARDSYNLSAPKFMSDEQQLQFRLHMPDGMSLPATIDVYLEIALHGSEARIA